MKIFLSWSGETSRQYASLLNSWLPQVIQHADPYFSPDHIEKGKRWFGEISKELEETSVGIICLTNTNLNEPWLMFEAGALAKGVEKSRVIPMLFGVKQIDLQGPLVQFQGTIFTRKHVLDLVESLNRIVEEKSLKPPILSRTFEKFWPELEEKVKEIMNSNDPEHEAVHRPDRELLEEILENSRMLLYESYYRDPLIDPIVLKTVDDLGFSSHTVNCLKSESIYYIGDLVQRTDKELLSIPNLRNKDLSEIKDKLAAYGLCICLRLQDWPPKFLKNDERVLAIP